MGMWRNLRLRLRALFDRESLEHEFDEEQRYHLECETEANLRQGMTPDEAARRARLEFGHSQAVREDLRDIRGDSLLESLFQDARFGLRLLRHNPTFTAVAAATLALGIGANAAMFSVINGVLLRPLPYQDPDHLVRILDSNPGRGFPRFASSPPNFLDWRAQAQSFSGLAGVTWGTTSLAGVGEPVRLEALYATPELFPVFGVNVRLGRSFTTEEGVRGRDKVVVLSYRLWQRQFGGQNDVIGRLIRIDGVGHTIVGVAPPEFKLYNADIVLPLTFGPDVASSRGAHYMGVFGRLKPGVSLPQAEQEIKAIAARLAVSYPDTNAGWTAFLIPIQELTVGRVRRGMLILFGAVGLLALIACANVANLLLARAAGRQRELSVRAALGASRSRIIRQLFAESLLLCTLGAVAGLGAASVCIGLLRSAGPADIPRLSSVRVDPAVLAFTLALTLLSTFLFGIMPALRASRVDLNIALKSAARGSTGGREWARPRNLLVFGELALSVMLLIGAALLIRSFVRLIFTDPGVDPSHVLTFNLSLPQSKYGKPELVTRFYDDLLGRLRSLPQVSSAEAVNILPLTGNDMSSSFTVHGQQVRPQDVPSAELRVVTPGYFQNLHIPLLRGRAFAAADNLPDAPVAIVVSESLARRHWPHGDAIGHVLQMGVLPGSSSRRIEGEIVGIVGDVRDFGLDVEPAPTVYSTFGISAPSNMTVVIRCNGDPAAVAPDVRSLVAAIDPDLPIGDLQPMERVLATSLAQRRFYMLLLSLFAGVALLLVSTGLYGVVSYSVSQRTREIGVRMALGARRGQVVGEILLQGLRLIAGGLVAGVVGALAFRGVMSKMLVGISAGDAIAFSSAAAAVFLVAMLACLLPARRATAVDPMAALRYE